MLGSSMVWGQGMDGIGEDTAMAANAGDDAAVGGLNAILDHAIAELREGMAHDACREAAEWMIGRDEPLDVLSRDEIVALMVGSVPDRDDAAFVLTDVLRAARDAGHPTTAAKASEALAKLVERRLVTPDRVAPDPSACSYRINEAGRKALMLSLMLNRQNVLAMRGVGTGT